MCVCVCVFEPQECREVCVFCVQLILVIQYVGHTVTECIYTYPDLMQLSGDRRLSHAHFGAKWFPTYFH